MRHLMIVFLILLSGCLQGCIVYPMTNRDLFGQTAGDRGPGIFVEAPNDVKVSATGNMKLKAKGDGDIKAGQFKLDIDLDSNVSEPLKEYPAWINSMAPAQQMNFQWAYLSTQEITKQYQSANDVFKTLIAAGVDVAKVAPQLFPSGIGGGSNGMTATPVSPMEFWNSLPPEMRAALLKQLMGNTPVAPVEPPPVEPTPEPVNP